MRSRCDKKEEKKEATVEKNGEDSFDRETVLSNMGIDIKGDKITIDSNKTKVFLEELGERIDQEINATQKEIEEGNFTSEKMGIEITKEKVSIDLNQTKNFLQNIIDLMESLTK
ncbi:MAG: hypothetical protein P8Y49_08530 [Sulfurovaceae bacterium]